MVSVIIPNYNHREHLRQRIDSVLHQTYRDIEVIILDDCSTDGSQEIIRAYEGHPLVRDIVWNEKNSGSPFKQWQRGIELANGEWIWIAESDDYADAQFIEKLIFALPSASNVGLLYCDSKIVSGNDVSSETFATIKNKKFHTTRWSENHQNSGTEEIENFLLAAGTINNTSAVLFNTKILVEANPFDIPLRFIGDKYAFMKVLTRSDVVYVKEALNYFRDPFNVKHVGGYTYYFYEQILVYDWALKNLSIKNKKKFYEGFYANTRNSIFRGWSKTKVDLYLKSFAVNPKLFLKSVIHNLWQSFRKLTSPGQPPAIAAKPSQ